jgi:aspartate carbamoyltransferase catalytic subunit
VSLLDDNTGYCEIRLLKGKDGVSAAVKEMILLWENQTGLKVKAVRSDNGHEYVNKELEQFYKDKGISYAETEDMNAALDADFVYMTRVQQERFADKSEYERLKLKYILTADQVRGKKAIVMHPLPRVGEISTDVDALPNAAYFRQARNGVPVRMALLKMLLGQ